MVADTLEVGYGVEIEHTRFGVALLAVEAEDMRILAFEGQVVDMLLKVGEFLCLVVAEQLVIKRRHRTLKQCNDTAAELVELLPRGVGELEPLADIVLSRFGEVNRMVADALDIVYRVEDTVLGTPVFFNGFIASIFSTATVTPYSFITEYNEP